MIAPSHIIGRHLSAEIADLERFDGPCAVCGADGGAGLPVRKAFGSTFADGDVLTGGRFVCEYCLRCLGRGVGKADALRNFSYLATDRELRILKREDLWDVLMSPPHNPFVLAVSFDHKKHAFLRARVNPGGSPYWVATDRDVCWIDLVAMAEAIEVMQRWYTVCRDVKTDPTWFTKEHILHGCTDVKRILAYGAERFRTEDAVLARWRGDHALDVLVYALNKRPFAAQSESRS